MPATLSIGGIASSTASNAFGTSVVTTVEVSAITLAASSNEPAARLAAGTRVSNESDTMATVCAASVTVSSAAAIAVAVTVSERSIAAATDHTAMTPSTARIAAAIKPAIPMVVNNRPSRASSVARLALELTRIRCPGRGGELPTN